MLDYPFEHDGPVFLLSDGICESVYYARGLRKYKRSRTNGYPEWLSVKEQEIAGDTFWMVVACIERSPRRA